MDVSALVSHLQDPTFLRPPPWPQPRPGAPELTARRWLQSASRAPAARLPRPGRGWQPASAGPARGAGRSQGRGPGRGRRPNCAALDALLGGALRCWQLARDPPLQPPGARRLHFPFGPPRFLPRGGSGGFLSGKLRGSFPGLLAPPQFSAPSPLLGSWCWPAPERRLWEPEPGGAREPRSRWPPTHPAM